MRKGLILPLLVLGCAVDIVRPGEDARFNAISAGDSHTCALADDGVAWCWGSNSHGQLGIGGGHESEARPVAVKTGVRYRSISAGRQHTCAIDPGGSGWCWGANDSGQLGDGTFQDRDVPGRVRLPRRLSNISAGRLIPAPQTRVELSCTGDPRPRPIRGVGWRSHQGTVSGRRRSLRVESVRRRQSLLRGGDCGAVLLGGERSRAARIGDSA